MQQPVSFVDTTQKTVIGLDASSSGFEKKTVYVVPNLPSPLFATMHKLETPPTPPPATAPTQSSRRQSSSSSPGGSSSSDRDRSNRRPPPQRGRQPTHTDDEDGTLEPSFGRP